jgi:hypothetical protein
MRIDIRIEQINGAARPVLFFPDDIERDKSIGAFSEAEGHVLASRAYMRGCKKPESPTERAEAWAVLERYSRFAKSHE